ncbi:MAG: PrsW family intramembrane metalloprotease, partial [Candidatus Dadabacteria bacterium]
MKMNPAVKAYILYGSPLKTARGRAVLIVILAAVFACAVAGRFSIGAPTLMNTYAWMGYSIVGSLAAYFIIGFLDRKRSVKWFHLLVVLTVALQSAFCAAFFNDISPIKLYTVGFVEEFFKILPVLLLA